MYRACNFLFCNGAPRGYLWSVQSTGTGDRLKLATRRGFAVLFFNHYRRALINEIEQFDDVGIAHPYTAATRGIPDFVFVFRAVNVNKPFPGVGVVPIDAVKP